ncbi:neuroglian-like [Mizuhopecten yessoensis]|uniref:Neuroglian n=1 Tax=Mizuhopecten yessoensis TaxID=6573 RepID=A0A210QYQ1_MIZYE|nr:neuroglian-like [Mizuhopecten yessoensis]XP_021346406.1 neuroglian-like [Mizuhopecten yessoensis]XP_021346407.1 neuroglian-like [Mizuhopecten yessoensis]XP_021346408.1 neuroglian-like [Mizuhopecten yessoensis]XP_021346409.1 neuroglian-like [Mizuhopecten yessoensis]OWF53856.1 Neuroglian [Mizuhopecten yessoensis]
MVRIFPLLLVGSSVMLCHAQSLETPPSMKSDFKQQYYLSLNGNVKFSKICKADGYPEPVYSWKVNGIQIQSHQFRTLYDNGTLFISVSNSTYNQYGEYQCFATNSKGVAMSSMFSIIMPVLNGFPVESQELGLKEEYKYQVLKCVSRPRCVPEAACSTEWKIGDGTDKSVTPTDRVAFSEDGSMHFLYLKRGDQLGGGLTYGCGVWNQVMSVLVKGSPTKFSVKTVDDEPLHPVEVKYSKDATGLLGYSARLQCIFSGYPLPTISWRTEFGKNILSDGTKYEMENFNRVLVVKSLKKEDEMSYACIALQQTKTGSTYSSNSTVYLNVTARPQPFPNQMENVVAPKDTDAEFSCKSYSLKSEAEPIGPFWYFNGKEITEAEIGLNQRYITKENGTVLVIQNIQKEFTGSFQCMSYNSEGTFMRDATLVVIEPILVQISPPPTMEILPKDVKYLDVAATTDPLFTLRYSWSFTNGDDEHFYNNDIGSDFGSNFPPELTLSADRQNLTIDGSNLDGGDIYKLVGTYSLRVYHNHDAVDFVTDMKTDASITPAPVVTSSAGGFNPIIIAIILGVIVLFIVIFLIVFLLYRNRGGTYPLDKKELAAGHDPEKELADSGFHDLSRADGFDDEKPTNDRMSLNDSEKDYESDDNFDQEYGDGDFDTTKFNEDGSFIGQYTDSKRRPPNQSVV